MISESINKKFLAFWVLLFGMLASFTITIIFKTHLTDELSIATGILAGIALFFTSILILYETITDICNP